MKSWEIECRECGKPFTPRQGSALFCSGVCRGSFNRRRRERGTELYDFVMAQADGAKCGETVKTLLSAYRKADEEIRDGRKSYQPLEQALTRVPVVHGDLGDKR